MKVSIDIPEINSCPFCEREAELTHDLIGCKVTCKSCRFSSPVVRVCTVFNETFHTSGLKAEAKAISLWNSIKGGGE